MRPYGGLASMNERMEERTSEWTIKRIEVTTKQLAKKSKHL